MKALTRLLLWQKFAILGVLALVLVAVPTYQFVNASLVQINFAATERTGIPPSLSLIELIPLLESHRALSAALLSGNDAVKAQVDSTRAKIDAGIKAVAAQVDALADDRSRASWERVKQDWSAVAKSVASRSVTVRESEAEQRKLVAGVFTTMDLVADYTLITLDPDVDTYYLHRMSLYEMAQLAESLAWLRDEGAGYLSRGCSRAQRIAHRRDHHRRRSGAAARDRRARQGAARQHPGRVGQGVRLHTCHQVASGCTPACGLRCGPQGRGPHRERARRPRGPGILGEPVHQALQRKRSIS